MSDTTAPATRPLWLEIESRIAGLGDPDFGGDRREATIQRVARELDETGVNVSRHAGNMLELRTAVDARARVGRPLLGDLDDAVTALALEDLANVHTAAVALTRRVGDAWPRVKEVQRRPDIEEILEARRLDLLITRAKGLEGDRGVRFLIGEGVPAATIIDSLGIDQARYDQVVAAIAAEKAEAARVKALLADLGEASAEDRARHLITNDVSDENIVELAGIEQATIDAVKEAMAEELREKERLAAEAAAAKKAAAEGPALDAIPPDEMLEHIEAIREIMEFSDVEAEIRQMCEQSNIPKSLVDVAVADPDKLDELEKAAEG